ncbi:MAG: hypothetical protein ACOY0T_17785 [Myxococcota bacterium]
MSYNAVSDPPRPRAWLFGVLAGGVTLIAFVGYAFLSPASYRTSALVEVWPSNEKAPVKVEPLEAARRLHEAVLDRDVLATLAKERAAEESAEAKAQLGRSIESALQIDTVDGRAFTVSFRDSDRERVTKTCNWLAERLVERAPRVLSPDTSVQERALENERRRRVAALLAFLAAHPELAGQSSSSASVAELTAEKNRIEARLAEKNPEGAGNEDPAALVRRLTEVNAAIAAHSSPRANAPRDKKAASGLPAEVQQLLNELVRAKEASKTAASQEPPLKALLVSRAQAPTWPIEPDRPRVLLLGVVAAALVGIGASLLGRRRMLEEGDSAPPPGTSSFPPEGSSSFPPNTSSSFPSPKPSPFPTAAYASPAPDPSPPAASAETSETPPPEAERPAATSNDPGPKDEAEQRNEGDRVTPVSLVPARLAAARSERGLRAALEVNVPVDKSGSASARAQSARTTHVLGSPIPPIIAPGSRRSPSVGSGEQAGVSGSTTSYSYVSTPPPTASPSSSPRASLRGVHFSNGPHSSGPPTRRYVSSPPPSAQPPAAQDSSVVSIERTPSGWRPDLSLLPESRRNLCDEIYPFAVDSCCVMAVLGGADNGDVKSRLAAELALALAEGGHTRVLLLEGDLERSNVRRFLRVDMPRAAGFSQQLKARINALEPTPWVVLECSQSLHVLAEGAESEPELILSRPFEGCLQELRRYYNFIVIDGPMVSNTAACRAVHDVVDRVVFSHGRFGPSELTQATALFPGKRITVVPAFS